MRRAVRREGDVLIVEQEIASRREETVFDVLGPRWMLAMIRVRAGSVSYRTSSRNQVRVPWPSFVVAAPPWTVLETTLRSCRADVWAASASGPIPLAMTVPVAFPVVSNVSRIDWALASQLAAAAAAGLMVGRGENASSIALAVKARLDGGYQGGESLGAIAASLGVSPSTVSRCFKRALGLSPLQYRQRLKLLDAIFGLTEGTPILDAFAQAGFGDLAQSYRHFRALVCATPGAYSRPAGRQGSKSPKT